MSGSTVTIDRYVVDTLLRDFVGHDRSPSSFLVYLYLATRPATGRARHVTASHADIAHYTGLSKSGVQAAVRNLKRRRFVRVERAAPTATPVYEVLTPWRRWERRHSRAERPQGAQSRRTPVPRDQPRQCAWVPGSFDCVRPRPHFSSG